MWSHRVRTLDRTKENRTYSDCWWELKELVELVELMKLAELVELCFCLCSLMVVMSLYASIRTESESLMSSKQMMFFP